MKKMIGFFVVIVLLLSLVMTKQDDFNFLSNCSKILAVSDEKLADENYVLQNGKQYYYFYNDIDKLKDKGFSAYNFYFDIATDLSQILDCFSFVYEGEGVDDYKIYYGYYDGYRDFRYVDGKKINVQVVKNDHEIIVGFPLIVTGY